jgi:hypothetical protein
MGRWNSGAEEDPDLMPPSGCSGVFTNHRDRGGDRYSVIFPNPPSTLGIATVTVVPEGNVTNNFQWPEVPVTTTYTIDGDSPVGQIEVTPITRPPIPDHVLSMLFEAYPGRFEAWEPAEINFVERDGIEQSPGQSACGTEEESSIGTKRRRDMQEPRSRNTRLCH